MTGIIEFLQSDRAKMYLIGLVSAFLQKFFPDYMPSTELMGDLYALLLALIVGDTIRPLDKSKKGLFQDLGNSLNDGLKNAKVVTVEVPAKPVDFGSH